MQVPQIMLRRRAETNGAKLEVIEKVHERRTGSDWMHALNEMSAISAIVVAAHNRDMRTHCM